MSSSSLSFWYKGSLYDPSSYRVLACNELGGKIYLCINPQTGELGSFEAINLFTSLTPGFSLVDNQAYYICLLSTANNHTLIINGETIVANIPIFDIDTYPIDKFGGFYPDVMSFQGGLAPQALEGGVPGTGLAPKARVGGVPGTGLAPRTTILSKTTHANGWIDDVRKYDRILSASEIESIIYHTLMRE